MPYKPFLAVNTNQQGSKFIYFARLESLNFHLFIVCAAAVNDWLAEGPPGAFLPVVPGGERC